VQISWFVEPTLGDNSIEQILSHKLTNPSLNQKIPCILYSPKSEDFVLQDKTVRRWVIGTDVSSQRSVLIFRSDSFSKNLEGPPIDV
jgi:hypothetical protein